MAPPPVWVLAHRSQESLAMAVVDCCRRSSGSPVKGLRKAEYKPILRWDQFADGFPNLFIDDVKELAGKHVILIASFHSVDVIFEQISMIYSVPRYLAHSVTVILPYFPTGTMERIDLEGQVATAKTLAMLLSLTPPTANGPTQVLIFDIHALQERFYFSSNVIPRLESAVPLVVAEVERLQRAEWSGAEVAVAFPDDGAQKRFGQLFPPAWPRITCAKVRVGDRRIVKLREGDPKGKHVVLIDDLIQTGGTMIEAAKVLRLGGAQSVSGYVTHAVFPNESWRKFVGAETSFERFWITDSMPHARHIAQQPPFQLLSLAPLIASVLLGFDLKCNE